jgi:uncharacterized membrane protein
MPAGRHWPELSIIVCGVLVVVVGADLALPGRLGLALVFVLLFPGTALVRLLELDDPVAELTLAVVVSVAVTLVIAGVSAYAFGLSAEAVLLALVTITIAANALEVARARGRAQASRSR